MCPSKLLRLEDRTGTKLLPILPLLTNVFFPDSIGALQIRKPHNKQIFDGEEEEDEQNIGLVLQKDPAMEVARPKALYNIGIQAKVLKKVYLPEELIQVIIQGTQRIQVLEYIQEMPYLVARVGTLAEKEYKDSVRIGALMAEALTLLEKLVYLDPGLSEELLPIIKINLKGPGNLADLIASNVGFSLKDKQILLETLDGKERLERIIELLEKELKFKQVDVEIRDKVQVEVEKSQREYYLRQQMATIKRELGEESREEADIEELKGKIIKKKFPPLVKTTAEHELTRLEGAFASSPEYQVIHTYLDWIISLPWKEATQDRIDLNLATKILDRDHYGLEKVKERILEFLAVHKLKKDMKGPILCFVGPPGVGKTSLGKSIAQAIGRKFIRISVGGVRDEAEIRGHRRTYVGAMPGKILQGLRRAGTNNPLFMIDEIDKMGADVRGDPYSALLEVLDPEQNRDFVDHYLDLPFDLSRVLFITTANVLYSIPAPLRDRMEVMELNGYTEGEKLVIAKKYLVPKQLKENGLNAKKVRFTDEAIRGIIRDYTREAGLRNLERAISGVCRKVAKLTVLNRQGHYSVDYPNLTAYLGPVTYLPVEAERGDEVGVATGLAWTPTGGDILYVEAIKMRGNGKLQLTGKLGEIMRESAQAALSYVKSKANELDIPEDAFDKWDIHIHIPEGAIPKDGPSAGVTLAVALASLMNERPVKHQVAMSGEITLRGKVLPVGGIREKVLAAHGAGLKTVILPARNQQDLADLPEQVKAEINFIWVENIQQVFENAIYDIILPKSPPSAYAH